MFIDLVICLFLSFILFFIISKGPNLSACPNVVVVGGGVGWGGGGLLPAVARLCVVHGLRSADPFAKRFAKPGDLKPFAETFAKHGKRSRAPPLQRSWRRRARNIDGKRHDMMNAKVR